MEQSSLCSAALEYIDSLLAARGEKREKSRETFAQREKVRGPITIST